MSVINSPYDSLLASCCYLIEPYLDEEVFAMRAEPQNSKGAAARLLHIFQGTLPYH